MTLLDVNTVPKSTKHVSKATAGGLKTPTNAVVRWLRYYHHGEFVQEKSTLLNIHYAGPTNSRAAYLNETDTATIKIHSFEFPSWEVGICLQDFNLLDTLSVMISCFQSYQ